MKKAPPELVKEVIEGKKSLNKAIKEITPPKPIAPKPVPVIEQESDETHEEQLSNNIDEQQDAIKALDADNKFLLKTFEPDERISASIEEIKKLTEVNRVLNERINGLMAEKDEAIKSANYWKDQYLELEAELNKV